MKYSIGSHKIRDLKGPFEFAMTSSITSHLLMHWLRVCVTLCIASAVANALTLMPGVVATLRWSNLICDGSGSISGTDITWKYSGSELTAELTVTGTGADFPEIPDGQYWKADKCYKGIRQITVTGLTSIGAQAFNNLQDLREITGASVSKIGDYALADCPSLTSTGLKMPVQDIGVGAFKNAKDFTDLTIQSGNINVGDYAFEGSGLVSLDISQATVTTGKGVLKDCKSLTTFKGGNNLATIPESCFEGCDKLTLQGLSLGAPIQVFGKRAFFGCSSLQLKLRSEDVTTSIGESAFEGSGLVNVDLTKRHSSFTLGAAAFKDCTNLLTANLGSMPTIPDSLFDGCSALSGNPTSVAMENIGSRAFFGCSSLTGAFVTASVTKYIGESAWEGSGLTDVAIVGYHESFTMGAAVFKNCKNIKSLVWNEYPIMPDSIFEGSGLEKVLIADVVTKFGESCFRDCKSLKEVVYNGVVEAPSSLLAGCDALESVKVPNNYPSDHFGGYRVRGLSLGAKIGIGVGVAAFVIIVIVVVVVVLFVTGKIGGGKRDSDAVEA